MSEMFNMIIGFILGAILAPFFVPIQLSAMLPILILRREKNE